MGRGSSRCAVTEFARGAVGLLDHGDRLGPGGFARAGDHQGEGQRQADVFGDVEDRLQDVLITPGRDVGHELQQPAAAVDDAAGDRLDLLASRFVTRNRSAAFGFMDHQPRRRETQRPGLDGLLGQRAHPGQILFGGGFAVGAALAHHIHPQRRVRQVGRDVDVPPSRLQGVQVFGEGLPGPGQAVGHHHPGDVLDTGHHVDQHVVVLLAARREPDAAVAHHHRGHPVRRGRRQPVRPDGLAVVVGVQVDEARRDQQPRRIDHPRRRGPLRRADRGDHAVPHRDITDERLTPDPSTMVPLRRRRS